jgi:hypothetical protein
LDLVCTIFTASYVGRTGISTHNCRYNEARNTPSWPPTKTPLNSSYDPPGFSSSRLSAPLHTNKPFVPCTTHEICIPACISRTPSSNYYFPAPNRCFPASTRMRSTWRAAKKCVGPFVPAAEIRARDVCSAYKKLSERGETMTMNDHVVSHDATEVIVVSRRQCDLPLFA